MAQIIPDPSPSHGKINTYVHIHTIEMKEKAMGFSSTHKQIRSIRHDLHGCGEGELSLRIILHNKCTHASKRTLGPDSFKGVIFHSQKVPLDNILQGVPSDSSPH